MTLHNYSLMGPFAVLYIAYFEKLFKQYSINRLEWFSLSYLIIISWHQSYFCLHMYFRFLFWINFRNFITTWPSIGAIYWGHLLLLWIRPMAPGLLRWCWSTPDLTWRLGDPLTWGRNGFHWSWKTFLKLLNVIFRLFQLNLILRLSWT